MAQRYAVHRKFVKLEPVSSDESVRLGESKTNATSRLIGLYDVPYRAMPANCTDAKWAVETHRGPAVVRPQKIIPRRKTVDEDSDFLQGRVELALMNIDHTHVRLTRWGTLPPAGS
jgi:hypothetical protein